MKRFLLSFLIFSLLGTAFAEQRVSRVSGSRALNYVRVENNNSATVTLLNGVTNRSIYLYKYTLSVNASDTVFLRCGASGTPMARKYLAASSGLAENMWPFYVVCAAGESLQLVKGTASTPVAIDLWWTQE